MAITKDDAGGRRPTSSPRIVPTTPVPAPDVAETRPASAAPDPSEPVPEVEVKIATFRAEPEPEKPGRGQIPARGSYYLNPHTGELRNRGGHGWVELTLEQTAVAEVLPQRKRAAWWRQQVRTGRAGR